MAVLVESAREPAFRDFNVFELLPPGHIRRPSAVGAMFLLAPRSPAGRPRRVREPNRGPMSIIAAFLGAGTNFARADAFGPSRRGSATQQRLDSAQSAVSNTENCGLVRRGENSRRRRRFVQSRLGWARDGTADRWRVKKTPVQAAPRGSWAGRYLAYSAWRH